MQGELSCSLHMRLLHVPCFVVVLVLLTAVEELRRATALNIEVVIEPDHSYVVRHGMLMLNCAP